ncbi:MAG: DEAD/DEAH box helicase [Kiritimatiellae bacterium]|nr:DEAD/DEAH box helicase [Kiritimatiellia bacterium]
MNFNELGLSGELLQAVSDLGFETPTEIQEKAIPILLGKDTDFVGLAQTGTGKTCAYGLPLLARIAPEDRRPQGVILCPTRELCMQIVLDMRQFAAHMKGVSIVPVYGGASINTQINQLRRGAHVVVATPGRMLDMMSRGVVDLGAVSVMILDEADEMLDMGFQEDIDQIFKAIPEEHLTWMFSATMGKEVQGIAESYLNDPVEVTVGTRNQTADNITHDCYIVKPEHRYHSLRRLLDMIPDMYALIFRRTRVETQELADMLCRDGYAVEALHGDLSQAQRDNVMGRFRRKQLKILIATDVAARGLDVDDITHVIHYDLPDDLEVYTHRSGRTARAGKQGCSIVFVSPAERYRLGQLERRLRIHFNAKLVPDGIDVCRQRLTRLAATIKDHVIDDERIAKFYPDVIEAFETVTREDLIKGLLARELNNLKGEHVSHQNLNADTGKKRFEKRDDRREERHERRDRRDDRREDRREDRYERRDEGRPDRRPERREERRDDRREGPEDGMSIFEINVGRADHINPGAIVRLVCDNAGIESRQIGHITLGEETSFFQVESSAADAVREKVRGADLDGQPVDIRDADTMPARGSSGPRPKKHFGGRGGYGGYRDNRDNRGGRPPYRKYDRR